MVQELSIRTKKMTSVNISNGTVVLTLTSPRSKVRICDENGNHVARPLSENITSNHLIEWMITNDELIQLIRQKFTNDEITTLISELEQINISLRDSQYYSRAAQKEQLDKRIGDFLIYKYEEIFYSFEKVINETLRVRITFKMGDFTLVAHMFVLIKIDSPNIELTNSNGEINLSECLGSRAKCKWSPDNNMIKEIAKALAHSSENHKKDIIHLLNNLISA